MRLLPPPHYVVTSIKENFVPVIREGITTSCELLRDRSDRYSEKSLGYISWDYSQQGFQEVCRDLPHWTLKERESILVYQDDEQQLHFRACRVDPDTRLPTSGRGAKKSATGWLFLPGVFNACMGKTRELLIAYDMGLFSGIGKITLQVLYTRAESMHTEILETLYDASMNEVRNQPIQREELPKGKLSRRLGTNVEISEQRG